MYQQGFTLSAPSGFVPGSVGRLLIDNNCSSEHKTALLRLLSRFKQGKGGKKNNPEDYTQEILRDGGSLRITIYSNELLTQIQSFEQFLDDV